MTRLYTHYEFYWEDAKYFMISLSEGNIICETPHLELWTDWIDEEQIWGDPEIIEVVDKDSLVLLNNLIKLFDKKIMKLEGKMEELD